MRIFATSWNKMYKVYFISCNKSFFFKCFFVLVNYNNPNLKRLVLHAVHSFTILLEIVRFLVFTAVCSPSRSYFYHSVTHGKWFYMKERVYALCAWERGNYLGLPAKCFQLYLWLFSHLCTDLIRITNTELKCLLKEISVICCLYLAVQAHTHYMNTITAVNTS